MVSTISTSGPFSLLVKKELLPQCRPEVWRQLFTKNAFTGEAYVGLDRIGREQAASTSATQCDGDSSERRSDGRNQTECLLTSLAADIAKKYPELERVDPVLPRLCALASAHESGLISMEEWARGFVRLFTLTLYHPVGTCKMGKPDPAFLEAYSRLLYGYRLSQHGMHQESSNKMRLLQQYQPRCRAVTPPHGDEQGCAALPPWSATAVVDSALRLCGGLCVQNVRIVDASVLPHLPSGNTHVPTILVAHIAAEDMAEKWGKDPGSSA